MPIPTANIETLDSPKSFLGNKFKRNLVSIAVLLSFSGAIIFAIYAFVGSPKELLLQQQNDAFSKQMLSLNLKISILNKKLVEIEQRDDAIYRPACELEPLPIQQRQVGFGGSDRYNSLKGYKNSKEIIGTSQELDRLGRKLYVQMKSFKEVDKIAKRKKDMLASIPAIQPISVGDLNYISSYYGFRDHPKLHRWIKHTGIDFAAPKGTPIYATGNGVVEKNKSSMSHYGKVVVIDHGFGYESLYAHMSKKNILPGDTVKRGQVIGYVGRTGRVTGVHLHYEVLKNGVTVNPHKYFFDDLNADQYDQMIYLLRF